MLGEVLPDGAFATADGLVGLGVVTSRVVGPGVAIDTGAEVGTPNVGLPVGGELVRVGAGVNAGHTMIFTLSIPAASSVVSWLVIAMTFKVSCPSTRYSFGTVSNTWCFWS